MQNRAGTERTRVLYKEQGQLSRYILERGRFVLRQAGHKSVPIEVIPFRIQLLIFAPHLDGWFAQGSQLRAERWWRCVQAGFCTRRSTACSNRRKRSYKVVSGMTCNVWLLDDLRSKIGSSLIRNRSATALSYTKAAPAFPCAGVMGKKGRIR